jgi:hypothetical protein
MNKPNNPYISYISREDFRTMLWGMYGDISTDDIAWWLETKTEKRFTVVQVEFVTELLKHLDSVNMQNIEFKNKWRPKVAYLRTSELFK